MREEDEEDEWGYWFPYRAGEWLLSSKRLDLSLADQGFYLAILALAKAGRCGHVHRSLSTARMLGTRGLAEFDKRVDALVAVGLAERQGDQITPNN